MEEEGLEIDQEEVVAEMAVEVCLDRHLQEAVVES
jgi:hypothetical protein